ncbi:phosphofructokinase [Paenibacillus sp. A3]|uniref:1-phosphofructokinase n=1 Tax=Paenibacillus sp. A3 TaxID=1337054 RepID=UPI0006D5A299|nr:1-phosphofructokinase [Paenibacillus sp. A3]KPV56678.1 phosphofructokinase [Paenibacillus sp. A3]
MSSKVLTVTLNPALDKTVTIEEFVSGGLNRIKAWRTDAGGKGINVAKALKHFSVDVASWGLTAGHQGKIITEQLAGLNIPSFFIETEGETRTNLKVYVECTKETTEFNEAGFTVDRKSLHEFIERYTDAVRNVSVVVLGGSLPPGAPDDTYKTLIEIANRAGARTVLDADGEPFTHGIEAVPYAIKPNIHELESLFKETFQSDTEIVSAARRLTGKGIAYVSVSLGAEGSILVSETEAVRAKPFPIVPLSTVGAGDSMVAALVYCLLEGKLLEEMARWTSAAGTVTASKPGTEVCTLAEVEEKVSKVTIWPL